MSLASPAMAGRFFNTSGTWEGQNVMKLMTIGKSLLNKDLRVWPVNNEDKWKSTRSVLILLLEKAVCCSEIHFRNL